MSHVSAEEMDARKEAAAKITANREVIVKRLLSHSGVVRGQGSPYGETIENVNGALLQGDRCVWPLCCKSQ
jgi:hypothetical protein